METGGLKKLRFFGHATIAAATLALLLAAPGAAQPTNDDFGHALALVGESGSQPGTNVDATAEAGEPSHAGREPSESVWYLWTAPADGTARFDTCTADFDTRLAAYTGSALASLSEVSSNDDAAACGADSLHSSISFVASAGETYAIAVDGLFPAESGTFTLSWSRAPLQPTNLSRPTVSGGTVDGATLTAANGSWSSELPATYTYQWQRCHATQSNVALTRPTTASGAIPEGESARAVDGSPWTAWNSGGFAPQWLEIDLQAPYQLSKIRANVNQLPDSQTLHELWVAGPNPKDEFALLRTFSGFTHNLDILEQPAAAGQVEFIRIESTQSASWISWRELEALAGCSDIAGAQGPSYAVTSADVGGTIRAIVRAGNASGPTAAASPETAAIAAIAPANVSAPTIAGRARAFETLTASPGVWRGSTPLGYAYQWQRCRGGTCKNVPFETESTFFISYGETGGTVRVVVTTTNSGGAATAASAATARVPYLCHVPKVQGRRFAAARRVLARSHCRVGNVRAAYSARVQRGRVISQQPKPESDLAQGGKVSVVVSRGPRPSRSRG